MRNGLLVLIVFVLVSCSSTKDEILNKGIEHFIDSIMHETDYTLDSISKLDTFYNTRLGPDFDTIIEEMYGVFKIVNYSVKNGNEVHSYKRPVFIDTNSNKAIEKHEIIYHKATRNKIVGNVFWLYNNFVGNRGDNGAIVRLISSNDNSILAETKADKEGDFEFNNVLSDYYRLMVVSKNVTQDLSFGQYPIEKYLNIMDTATARIFRERITIYDALEQHKELRAYEERLAENWGANRDWSETYHKRKKLEESLQSLVYDSIYSFIPYTLRKELNINSSWDKSYFKIKIQVINLKDNEDLKIAVDFASTYD